MIKNKNIIIKLLLAQIGLIIFAGLFLTLGLYSVFVVLPESKLLESSYIALAVLFFSIAFILRIIINVNMELPWYGGFKKYSPEEINKQNALLQSAIKKAEKLDC